MKPLATNKLISKEDHSIIFNGVEEILQINNEFLKTNLEPLSSSAIEKKKFSRRLTETSREVGRTFKLFAPIFSMYSRFVSGYEKSSDKLIELKSTKKKGSTKFLTFLNEQSSKKTNGKTIESLLISPIQRVPRYKLLLQELLKHTEEDKSDHADLKLALASISEVALKINASIAVDQEKDTMLQAHEAFRGAIEIFKPARRLERVVDVKVSGGRSGWSSSSGRRSGLGVAPDKVSGRLYVFTDIRGW